MEPRIRPEPAPEERAAIVAALSALLSGDGVSAAYRSAWRATGIRENLDADGSGGGTEAQGITALPRSGPGATRA